MRHLMHLSIRVGQLYSPVALLRGIDIISNSILVGRTGSKTKEPEWAKRGK
jgi:hypothetical protein